MYNSGTISIIVPVYNVAEYLPTCLDSLVDQTYYDLEIILIDDGSTDGSEKICNEYAAVDPRIKVIHQKNMGVAAARNVGISNATGVYIAFVDSDDWIDIDTFEIMLHDLGNADVITAGYWKSYGHSENKITEVMCPGYYDTKKHSQKFYANMLYSSDGIFDDTLASIWNKLFRLEVAKKFYKGLDLSLHYQEDTTFVYSYFLQCKSIAVSNKSHYHYRVRENSAVNSTYRWFLKNVNSVYLYLDTLFSKHIAADVLQPQLQKWIIQLSLYGINEKMGFCEELKLPIYAVPYQEKICGKKVVLYGAGEIGRAYWRSLLAFQIKPVLWIDNAYTTLQQRNLPISAPTHIYDCDFDYILIAVKEKEMAQAIRHYLEELGVAPEKILWKKPLTIF